ncbi:unnamed protein product [Amoebophrya sp. A25]|nr:unnamed protein product [Amoebophrya sp. A25]|eukprot:GSA25T00025642001.1
MRPLLAASCQQNMKAPVQQAFAGQLAGCGSVRGRSFSSSSTFKSRTVLGGGLPSPPCATMLQNRNPRALRQANSYIPSYGSWGADLQFHFGSRNNPLGSRIAATTLGGPSSRIIQAAAAAGCRRTITSEAITSSSASSSSATTQPSLADRISVLEATTAKLEKTIVEIEAKLTKMDKQKGFFARFMSFFQEFGTPFIVYYGVAYIGMWLGIFILFETGVLPDPITVLDAFGLEMPAFLAEYTTQDANSSTSSQGAAQGSGTSTGQKPKWIPDPFWVRVGVSFFLNEALEIPRFIIVGATFKPLLRLFRKGA